MRAAEMDKATKTPNFDVIAYCCRRYALKKAIGNPTLQKAEGAKTYLLKLMDSLEAKKPDLIEKYGEDIMTDETQQLALVKAYALNVYKAASNQYQAGKATKKTALVFNAAAAYFEVAGSDEPELITARKTAKFNATEIIKAIKEGRTPMPPKPVEEEEEEEEGGDGDYDDNAYGFDADLPPVPMAPALPKAPDNVPSFAHQPDNMTPTVPGFLDLSQGQPAAQSNAPAGAFARNLTTFEDVAPPRFGDLPNNAKLSVRGREFMSSKFNVTPQTPVSGETADAENYARKAVTALKSNNYPQTVEQLAKALEILERRKPPVPQVFSLSPAAQNDIAEYALFAARTLETAGQLMPLQEAKMKAAGYLSMALQTAQRG